jgi:hypothetical protein
MSDDIRNDGDSPDTPAPQEPNQEPKAEDQKPPGKRHLKAVQTSQIYATRPSGRDVVYLARELILCTLPHSDPGDVRAWGRRNGDLTLAIKPGVKQDRKTGEYFSAGIPYGIIPRLILMWMVTEIRRTRGRRLELGHHFNEFLAKIGLGSYTGRGPRGDARRVREQMERLFRAIISFDYAAGDGKHHRTAWLDMQVAPNGVFWWSEERTEEDVLWGSWIEVSEAFYQAVMAFTTPLDIRVLRHIKDSSLGIDFYTILNREAFRARQSGQPRFLAWEWLHEQTGNEIASLRLFRRNALVQIQAIRAVHPGLVITVQKGRKGRKSGLWVSHLSNPSIPPDPAREPVQRDPSRTPPALALVPPPQSKPPERPLKPWTVEAFRIQYPNLDIYACKAAFDDWVERLPPERKPRDYDSVFLSFAKKWVVGKL